MNEERNGRMGRCAAHPEVETSLRCASCDRYICPKDMVTTPVGYKCRECAAPASGARLGGMRGRQLPMALLCGLGAGVLGGLIVREVLAVVPFFPWLLSLLFGAGVAEAARRGSGGHRTPGVAAIAVAGAVLGALVGGFGLIGIVLAAAGAGGSAMANRL